MHSNSNGEIKFSHKDRMDMVASTFSRHRDDCTIYLPLSNGGPNDGLCTCGFAASLGLAHMSSFYSPERVRDRPNEVVALNW